MSFFPTRQVDDKQIFCSNWGVVQSREWRFCFKRSHIYTYYSSFCILHLNFWHFVTNIFLVSFCAVLEHFLSESLFFYYFGRDWMSKHKLLCWCGDRILKIRTLFCLWHFINILPSIKHVKTIYPFFCILLFHFHLAILSLVDTPSQSQIKSHVERGQHFRNATPNPLQNTR